MYGGLMGVILLHFGHQHVSATRVAISRVVKTIIQIQSKWVAITPQFICI